MRVNRAYTRVCLPTTLLSFSNLRRPTPQAVLVAAYTRRLQRLARLLQRYDARLGQALAALGLQGQQEQQEEGGGTDAAAAPARAASALAQGLAQAEGDVLAALSAADAAPEPQALLQLGSDCAQLAAQAAAAGRAAILAELQGGRE